MEKLTENDYKLLKYISGYTSVSEAQVENHFKSKLKAPAFRITELTQKGYILSCEKVIDDYENIRTDTDIFAISPVGQTALQDHFAKKKIEIRNRIIAISTLILSAITAVASVIAALK